VTADRAFEFIENVARDTDAASISRRLFVEASALGFTGMAMGWLPVPGSDDATHFQVEALPQEYFRRYSERRYDRYSAIVRHMGETNLPFRWDEVPVDQETDPLGYSILGEARDFGIRSGWSIPVYRQGALRGFATVTSASVVERSPDLFQFHLMTLCAHARVQDLRHALGAIDLHVRERDILGWLASGKSLDEIARVLGVSYRSAATDLAGAGMKLGTSNAVQTIIEAVRRGLI